MKKLFLLTLLCAGLFSFASNAKKADTRYFEMRIYYCHPGRLDALIQRFTNHTTKIFEKHGMTNVGYWIPTNNTDNALYYILAYHQKLLEILLGSILAAILNGKSFLKSLKRPEKLSLK